MSVKENTIDGFKKPSIVAKALAPSIASMVPSIVLQHYRPPTLKNQEYSLIVPSAMTIFLLLITARDCMRSTNFLAHNVHKIRHDIEGFNISTRLQSFTLQMLHQQIIIDGFGFFVLKCDMARDMLGSIATYMIFFIQFMPKFKSF
ncbi:PREDICTED: gustatory receptor 8a-like [Rhagoletis zephyria]|uniref:gustatory receptor 8a-like n=1 Tax=Rhagoletis zephyria TaxID=28612 RepID=UPI0008115A35|nr:PREDICTED: gustatory receptor 8a-like [Rhagoletis zephyria]